MCLDIENNNNSYDNNYNNNNIENTCPHCQYNNIIYQYVMYVGDMRIYHFYCFDCMHEWNRNYI